MSCLLLDAKALVEQARSDGLCRLTDPELAELHGCFGAVIALGDEQNPALADRGPGRRRSAPRRRTWLLRLDQREGDVPRFAHAFEVLFDNNLAERDLRMIKLQQKISGCGRISQGAERFLKVRSYVSTARKQGHRPLTVLTKLTGGQPWLPARAPT